MKKLSHSSNQGKKEFLNEAKLLARVQHRNVVNLLGYCVHGVEKLLVYEYVSNESLDKLLFSKFSVTLLTYQKKSSLLLSYLSFFFSFFFFFLFFFFSFFLFTFFLTFCGRYIYIVTE